MQRPTDPAVRAFVRERERKLMDDVERMLRAYDYDEETIAEALRSWRKFYQSRGEDVVRKTLGLFSGWL